MDTTLEAPREKENGESAALILRVAVGSDNPCKINSVRDALLQVMLQQSATQEENKAEPLLQVEGFHVESGVTAQPMGDDETQLGAKNRAMAAYQCYEKKFHQAPHLAFGLEGGLEWSHDKSILWCMAWMACCGKKDFFLVDLLGGPNMAAAASVITGEEGNLFWGLAKTASFAMPPPITEYVKQGMELGEADDKVFDRINSKQGSGTVGILSNGIISRSSYYQHALVLALVPWIRADVYSDGCASQSTPRCVAKN
jgi:inosine/xanthosine triphosphatase